MIRGTLAALLVATAIPCVAQAQNFEVVAIGNGDENGSNFYMLSLRSGLSFGRAVTEEGTARNAQVGLRLRVDVARTTYDTNYNNTPGTGTGKTYRLLLAYGVALDADTTLTFTGGASHRTVEVRPTTLNSPDDTSDTGPFASIDLEYSPESFGSLQLLAEHDGVGANYGAVTYLANIGQNVRIGPTANYISEGDYSRKALGVSAIYAIGDAFEIKATAANATQQITGNPDKDVDYLEVQLRTVF